MSDANRHSNFVTEGKLIAQVAEVLRTHHLKLAVAESCTGGALGKACTDLAGSSQWFAGGIIAYSNKLKESLLHVESNVLRDFSAVSEEISIAMCAGVLRSIPEANIAAAVSGNAGPTGEPQGLVWLAVQKSGGIAQAQRLQVRGSRAMVREQAVEAMLKLILLRA